MEPGGSRRAVGHGARRARGAPRHGGRSLPYRARRSRACRLATGAATPRAHAQTFREALRAVQQALLRASHQPTLLPYLRPAAATPAVACVLAAKRKTHPKLSDTSERPATERVQASDNRGFACGPHHGEEHPGAVMTEASKEPSGVNTVVTLRRVCLVLFAGGSLPRRISWPPR